MLFGVAGERLRAAIDALTRLHIEEVLLPILIQLAVIITAARLFGLLARRLGQPSVIGEILAGLLLGPSLLGALFPGVSDSIFMPRFTGVPEQLAGVVCVKILGILSQIGLIFFLFLVGLEFEAHHLRDHGRSAVGIGLAGMILPFAFGALLAPLIYPYLEPIPATGRPAPLLSMALLLGTAFSITAIPVLGRIMHELGIQRTRLGTTSLAAAALEDAIGWILLAAVVALSAADYQPRRTAIMLASTLALIAVMLFIVRPALIWFFRASMSRHGGRLSQNALALLMVAMVVASLATNAIGIFAIFGAFTLGAVLSDQEELRKRVNERLYDLVTVFFVPIFFTFAGLQTNLGRLNTLEAWCIALAIFALAVAGKYIGCGLAARWYGFSRRESAIIATLMNTRGIIQLVVIDIGRQIGVVPPSLYTAMVLMAVLTTIMTTPLLLALRRGTELEEPIRLAWHARR